MAFWSHLNETAVDTLLVFTVGCEKYIAKDGYFQSPTNEIEAVSSV